MSLRAAAADCTVGWKRARWAESDAEATQEDGSALSVNVSQAWNAQTTLGGWQESFLEREGR